MTKSTGHSLDSGHPTPSTVSSLVGSVALRSKRLHRRARLTQGELVLLHALRSCFVNRVPVLHCGLCGRKQRQDQNASEPGVNHMDLLNRMIRATFRDLESW